MKANDTKFTIGKTKLPATVLGYGGGGISNMYAAVSEDDALASVEAAWDAGIRLFDTAPFYGYGLAERRMGDVLRSKPRDEFLLSSKVGRLLEPRAGKVTHDFFPHSPMPFNPVYDYSYDAAMRSFEDSLQRIGVDRLDILLIHDIGVAQHGQDAHPELFKTCMDGAAKALVELREQNVVGAIGIGANEWQVAVEALEHVDFDVFLMAGRYSLLEHEEPYNKFFPVLEKTSAKLLIGGAFNSGILAAKRPDQQYFNYEKASEDTIAKVDELRKTVEQHNCTLPAAAIQFPAQHQCVATVLFGARTRAEVEENVASFNSDIPEQFWDDMNLSQYRS